MIKKIFKTLFVSGLLFLPFSFSNAQEVVNNSVLIVDIPDSFVVGNFTYDIDRNLNFHTDGFGDYLDWVNYPLYNEFHNIYGWINDKLYYVSYDLQQVQGLLIGQQGFIDSFCATTDISQLCTDFNISASQFYDMQKNITKVAFGTFYWGSLQGADGDLPIGLCFYNDLDSKYYCAYSSWIQSSYNTSSLIGSLGFSTTGAIENYNWSTSPIINNPIQNNPISGGIVIDGYDYISLHTGNYISYWEDRGFTQDMCYVGTRDLISVYEDRLTYYQGTGYTIFDTYSKLFNVDSFSISQMGTFINYWLINYDTWFLGKNRYIDSTPYYNMIYNSPSDYYVDKGPNLTNIFVGNKAVYYFLASTIRDRSSYIDDGTIGEEVATYCYYKLTRYANVSNDGQVYNINDDHDSSYDSNVAVYVGNKLNGIGSGITFSGANVINSQSWDGSVLDYFTGENYTDFNSFFSSSFNRFKYLFDLKNGDYGLGFLPSYIIIFLLGIIFFRFLRH